MRSLSESFAGQEKSSLPNPKQKISNKGPLLILVAVFTNTSALDSDATCASEGTPAMLRSPSCQNPKFRLKLNASKGRQRQHNQHSATSLGQQGHSLMRIWS